MYYISRYCNFFEWLIVITIFINIFLLLLFTEIRKCKAFTKIICYIIIILNALMFIVTLFMIKIEFYSIYNLILLKPYIYLLAGTILYYIYKFKAKPTKQRIAELEKQIEQLKNK